MTKYYIPEGREHRYRHYRHDKNMTMLYVPLYLKKRDAKAQSMTNEVFTVTIEEITK